ncbi:hypothetical protein AB0F03_35815 [Streptomyces sp. NPDC028722]|uniref:hypothetical protein n=1 Tax=Streptomyces sp. NPDC028722 TaxID=3155016 RepID=UPI0033DAB5D9
MPDLLWDDVRNFFDPDLMGALPEVSVTDTSVDDWQAVFDLAGSNGWTWEYSEGCVRMSLPSAQEVLSRPTDADTALLKVWPVADVQVSFWPMSAGDVDHVCC